MEADILNPGILFSSCFCLFALTSNLMQFLETQGYATPNFLLWVQRFYLCVHAKIKSLVSDYLIDFLSLYEIHNFNDF